MKDYQTGAVRDTGGKGRMDLLPWSALLRVSRHMENAIKPDPKTGVPHYPERNWEKGLPIHTMIDSAFRHLAKYVDGWVDEDHLCAAATNLLMAMWMEEHIPQMQDIPSRGYEKVRVSPGVSDIGELLTPTSDTKVEGEATEHREDICGYYDYKRGRCNATRDFEWVGCGGDQRQCSEYPTGCVVAEVPRAKS